MNSVKDKEASIRTERIELFCTFHVADHLFGVNILDVKEVNPECRFTTIFHAPNEVQGYVNIRGRIHLILNLRRILGYAPAELDEKSRLVLFKPKVGDSFGILVDAIGDVVEVPESLIDSGRLADDPTGDSKMESRELITGVCRLKNALMPIINARNLLKVLEVAA